MRGRLWFKTRDGKMEGPPDSTLRIDNGTRREMQLEIERLRRALTRIAEGNLGDRPWQANYDRIYDIAREALASSFEEHRG